MRFYAQKMKNSYEKLLGAINKSEIEAVPFSVPTSKRSSNQGDLVFSAMLRKLVGEEYRDQAAFLIHQLKKVSPKSICISVVIEDMKMLKDIAKLNDQQLKNYERNNITILKCFDKFLMKLAGSSSPVSQKKLLSAA